MPKPIKIFLASPDFMHCNVRLNIRPRAAYLVPSSHVLHVPTTSPPGSKTTIFRLAQKVLWNLDLPRTPRGGLAVIRNTADMFLAPSLAPGEVYAQIWGRTSWAGGVAVKARKLCPYALAFSHALLSFATRRSIQSRRGRPPKRLRIASMALCSDRMQQGCRNNTETLL